MDRLEAEREGGREIKGERNTSLPGKDECVCVCVCVCVSACMFSCMLACLGVCAYKRMCVWVLVCFP